MSDLKDWGKQVGDDWHPRNIANTTTSTDIIIKSKTAYSSQY
jgi:hypothetical protein